MAGSFGKLVGGAWVLLARSVLKPAKIAAPNCEQSYFVCQELLERSGAAASGGFLGGGGSLFRCLSVGGMQSGRSVSGRTARPARPVRPARPANVCMCTPTLTQSLASAAAHLLA